MFDCLVTNQTTSWHNWKKNAPVKSFIPAILDVNYQRQKSNHPINVSFVEMLRTLYKFM